MQRSWWNDWKSIAAVVGLLLAIGAGLILVNAKQGDDAGASAARTAAAAMPAPPSSPRRMASSPSGTAGANDAQSFLAFSRARKAAVSGDASGAPAESRSGGPNGERKVVLTRLSGECRVGGGTIEQVVKGLSSCFSRHDARAR